VSDTTGASADSLSTGQRWTVLLVTFVALVLSGAQLGLMPLAALSVSRDLLGEEFTPGLAGDWFARYTAAIMLGGALGGVLLGSAGDRIGRSRALGLSILFYSVFGGLGALARTQYELLALRFLTGVGIGGVWPLGVALVSECWSNVSRPTIAGVLGAGINVGILCMSQLGSLREVTAESWRWLMELSAWPALLAIGVIWLLPESPAWRALKATGTRQVAHRTRFELFQPPLVKRTLVGIALGAIPLVGAWGASKWMIPWADSVAGVGDPHYKATTQAYWAVGATLGSLIGSQLANLFGRRVTYFAISLGSTVLTCGIYVFLNPMSPTFLPVLFVQGFVTTLFFGWLPLYLPELYPTEVRAAGIGLTYNFGRIISAIGVLAAGTLMAWSGGDYARVGTITGAVYALGMMVIWFAPDTSGKLGDRASVEA
jgi:MFS family permease